jgi:uncharacterized DUF497 family protein
MDPLAWICDDEDHSMREALEIIIGNSVKQRLLVISFVSREDAVRLVNARKATRREHDDYEKNVKS